MNVSNGSFPLIEKMINDYAEPHNSKLENILHLLKHTVNKTIHTREYRDKLALLTFTLLLNGKISVGILKNIEYAWEISYNFTLEQLIESRILYLNKTDQNYTIVSTIKELLEHHILNNNTQETLNYFCDKINKLYTRIAPEDYYTRSNILKYTDKKKANLLYTIHKLRTLSLDLNVENVTGDIASKIIKIAQNIYIKKEDIEKKKEYILTLSTIEKTDLLLIAEVEYLKTILLFDITTSNRNERRMQLNHLKHIYEMLKEEYEIEMQIKIGILLLSEINNQLGESDTSIKLYYEVYYQISKMLHQTISMEGRELYQKYQLLLYRKATGILDFFTLVQNADTAIKYYENKVQNLDIVETVEYMMVLSNHLGVLLNHTRNIDEMKKIVQELNIHLSKYEKFLPEKYKAIMNIALYELCVDNSKAKAQKILSTVIMKCYEGNEKNIFDINYYNISQNTHKLVAFNLITIYFKLREVNKINKICTLLESLFPKNDDFYDYYLHQIKKELANEGVLVYDLKKNIAIPRIYQNVDMGHILNVRYEEPHEKVNSLLLSQKLLLSDLQYWGE